MKVVQDLGNAGYVETVRGRRGGVRLARPADQINVGDLVRHTEAGFALVDRAGCLIAPACGMPGILAEATRAFLSVLDGCTAADLTRRRSALRGILALSSSRAPPACA
jgi:Rrf2 family nitric oxide-sensitive transcriptional repressor